MGQENKDILNFLSSQAVRLPGADFPGGARPRPPFQVSWWSGLLSRFSRGEGSATRGV